MSLAPYKSIFNDLLHIVAMRSQGQVINEIIQKRQNVVKELRFDIDARKKALDE